MAARAAEDRKVSDVMNMEMRDLITVTEYFVPPSGHNPVQARAIADHVEDEAAQRGARLPHRATSGADGCCSTTATIHVFCEEERPFSAPERLRGDASKCTQPPMRPWY